MTRLAVAVDRFAVLITGLALLAVGLGMLAWNTGWFPDAPRMITAPGLVTASQTGWWPWAVAGAGVVLIVTALRWLFAHTPKAKVKTLRLSGGSAGTISTDLGAVADAAARVLEQCPDVDSAKARAVIDRGVRTIDLTVTTRIPVNMPGLVETIDSTCMQITHMLGDTSVATRTSIHVAKRHDR